jgi:hypothetical protein
MTNFLNSNKRPEITSPHALLNDEDPLIPEGSFFPLNLDLPPSGVGDPAAGHPESERGP